MERIVLGTQKNLKSAILSLAQLIACGMIGETGKTVLSLVVEEPKSTSEPPFLPCMEEMIVLENLLQLKSVILNLAR